MVVSSSQENELEARFAHLIQPIRDLTKNWEVDIASQLEDYLEEIESISITFDGGKTTLNFAEAALLIQGSTCVYSRKVEYLYAMVYQVLDLMASKKKLQQAASVDKDGNDKDISGTRAQTDEFLSLDNIKDHKNIDLKGGPDDATNKNVNVLPRVTLSLMPLEEGQKGHNPLLSRKGEVLGNRNDFKMNTCNIHPTGTLLLDLSQLNLLELSIQNKPSSTPFVPRSQPQITDHPGLENDPPSDGGLPMDISLDEDNACIDLPQDVPTEPEGPMPEQMTRQREKRAERNRNLLTRPDKPAQDPWQLLIQFNPTTEKPHKKKKTHQVLSSTSAAKNKKRKRQIVTLNSDSLRIFCNAAFYKQTAKFPKNSLKVAGYLDYESLYWAEYKRRQAYLRGRKRVLVQLGRQLAEEVDEAEEDCNDLPPADDDDDEDQNLRLDIPDVFDLGPLQGEVADPLTDYQELPLLAEDAPVVSSFEELVKHHVEAYLASAQQYAQFTDLSRRVTEWEEKIMPKLQIEDERGPFDIHKYGSRVISSFDLPTPTPTHTTVPSDIASFIQICRNKEQYEVCRLFLATLQLANNYNVELSVDGSLAEAMDTLSLQLLSTRRHFEELQEYRAPSFEQH